MYQRRLGAEAVRTRLQVRRSLRKSRAAMINTVRGTLRALGYRMGSASSDRFVEAFYRLEIPLEVEERLRPLLEMMVYLTERIAAEEEGIERAARRDELLRRLQTTPGIGPLVSTAYVAWIDDPYRFARSHSVGAYLGARPRIRDSGERSHHGHITREGDCEMRRLLVQAAHVFLNSNHDSALKRWGLELAERSGRKIAAVAVARKLAVLLHRLWVHEESFEPFPNAA